MEQGYLLTYCMFFIAIIAFETALLWHLVFRSERRRLSAEQKRNFEIQKSLMDCLGHGLISFNSKMLCSPVFSRSAQIMFECEIAGVNIFDVLKVPAQERVELEEWATCLFDKKIEFSSLDAIAPRVSTNSKRMKISLQFRRVLGPTGNVESVVLIATDRTLEEQAAKKLSEKADYVSRIIQIAKNKSKFRQLCVFAHNLMIEAKMFSQLQSTNFDTLNELKVSLHTLKGFSGFFRMDRMAQLIHEFERELEQHVKNRTDARVTVLRGLTKIRDYFREFIAEYDFIVGDLVSNTVKTLEVNRQELVDFLTNNVDALAELRVPLVRVTMAVSFNSALSFLQDYATELSQKLDKPINGLEIQGGEKKILVEHYQFIFDSLVHLVSNSLDHGIQNYKDRVAAGKSTAGNLKFRIEESLDRDQWYLIYEDDGTGIDVERVRAKWLEKKLADAANWSKRQLLQSILLPGFSMTQKVTLVSGRGVGLAVLKANIEKMGGQIEVDSELGKYTRFKIIIPQIWEYQSINPGAADVSGFLKAS